MSLTSSTIQVRDILGSISKNVWKTVTEFTPLTAFKLGMCLEIGSCLIQYLRKPNSDSEQLVMEVSSTNPIDEKRQSQIDKAKPPHLWKGVAIFFPDKNPESPDSPTNQLIWFFRQAKFRIQICVLLSSYLPIESVILEKIREGVLVQVITDYDTLTSHNNFNVTRWKKHGTEVKLKPNGHLMHNKYAIIDEQAVLTGSLNWTTQGITINDENVIVSTDYRIVDKYMEAYDKLWATCDDSSAHSSKLQ